MQSNQIESVVELQDKVVNFVFAGESLEAQEARVRILSYKLDEMSNELEGNY